MDFFSDTVNVSDDSNSGLQIDETNSSKKEIVDDNIINSTQDKLILTKFGAESTFDADIELNGKSVQTNNIELWEEQSIESVDQDKSFELHIVDYCDLPPTEQSKIKTICHTPKDTPKKLPKLAPKTTPNVKKINQLPKSPIIKNGTRKSNRIAKTRRIQSFTKKVAKILPRPPIIDATADDDYVDSEDISFNTVPRLHKSVGRPNIPQHPLPLVTNAVRQVEELFYRNRSCFICGRLANDSKDLGLHMMKNHSEITRGKWCYVCNEQVTGLFEHLQSHKNDVLKCPLCECSSANFMDLRSHILDHAILHLKPGIRVMPKWFLCYECPNAYAEEVDFNLHKSVHF